VSTLGEGPAWACFLFILIFCAQSSALLSRTRRVSASIPPTISDIADAGDSYAQSAALDLTRPEGVANYCRYVAEGKAWPAPLQAVCEFALSLRWKLPNVICEEERYRYLEGESGGEAQRSKVTANLRFENGQENFSEIRIDGRPLPSWTAIDSGLWSEGEFGSDLLAVFLPQSATQFKFAKEATFRSTAVLVFDFKVQRKNNQLWRVNNLGATTFPGYHGRLWIKKSTFQLMRLERQADDIEAKFPLKQVSTVIDYGDIELADRSDFVLPLRAVEVGCGDGDTTCWHDELTFKHWHKFAARARILDPNEIAQATSGDLAHSPATPTPNVPAAPDLSSLPMDFGRGIDVRAQLVAGEIAGMEQKLLEVSASVVPSKPAESATNLQTSVPSARVSAAPSDDQLPVFKASVRLVLVPTVVRDSRERVVDSLQKADFRLFDNNKPQLITQFSLERPGIAASRESTDTVLLQPTHAAPARYAAYVFDDIHANLDDLVRARDAANRHLALLSPGDRAAIFALSGNVMLDFTSDKAKLSDALQQIRPHPLTAGALPCPNITYEQADLIQKDDAIAISLAMSEARQCGLSADSGAAGPTRRAVEAIAAQVLIAGRSESQLSFKVLREAVRRMTRLPGQRSIVLVSPGFPTAEMQQELEGIIDDALKGDVIINILDPSGVSMSDRVQYGTASGSWDVLVDLTSGTGGTFFHNRNDMDEGFQNTALPEIFYILGFSPQRLDGRLHKLKVTLQRSEKLNVQARRGYYAAKSEN
jgi:VWFA-related protein